MKARFGLGGWRTFLRSAMVFIALLFLTPLATAAEPTTAPTPTKNVLILYDENRDFSGLTLLDQSLRAGLKAGVAGEIVTYTEFMDVSRFRDPAHEETLRAFYQQKYRDKKLDLVISAMAPSLDFVLKHRQSMFPDAPVLFCGVDNRELGGRNLGTNITGVLVKREFKPTVELALQQHPDTRHIVFVSGSSAFNRYWRDVAQRDLRNFESRVSIKYLSDLSIEAIEEETSKLPPNSLILYLHLFSDSTGRTFTPNDAMSRVARKANAPIYVFIDQFVGLGAVGGYVWSIEAHGAKVAEAGTRILSGKATAADIPVAEANASVYVFDDRELRRWSIDPGSLPLNSTVRYREESFWHHYRWHVIAAAVLIAAQAALIFALLFQRRRRRVAELGRSAAEAETRQQRLELAHVTRVATLGELSATLAHELNQPLAAITNNASAARRYLESPDPNLPEVHAALADITSDAARAAEVIHRLRAMLKPGKTDLERVDLNEVVRTVVHLAHSDAIVHSVSVDLDLAPTLPATIGDPIQLQQVILNLMINAFAALDRPGATGDRRIVLRTLQLSDSLLQVEVIDNGVGLTPDQIEQIFEPYVTTKPDGLGMGLPICRSIIERHDGRLWATSNPTGGATFTLTLPLAP